MTELTSAVLDYLSECSNGDRKRELVVGGSMEYIYCNCPYCDIKLEDASEFLLYIEPGLSSIIDGFCYFGPEYEHYLKSVMKRRATYFFSDKARALGKMMTGDLIYLHEMQRRSEHQGIVSDWCPLDNDADAGIDVQALCRIAAVCQSSLAWTMRMTVYFLYIMPLMERSDVEALCEFFMLDGAEAITCREKMLSLSHARHEERLRLFRQLGAGFFRRMEMEICLQRSLEDSFTASARCRLDLIKAKRELMVRKVERLDKSRLAVRQIALGQALGLSRGTISSHVFYARILIECAVNPECDCMQRLPLEVRRLVSGEYSEPDVRSKLHGLPFLELVDSIRRFSRKKCRPPRC